MMPFGSTGVPVERTPYFQFDSPDIVIDHGARTIRSTRPIPIPDNGPCPHSQMATVTTLVGVHIDALTGEQEKMTNVETLALPCVGRAGHPGEWHVDARGERWPVAKPRDRKARRRRGRR